MDLTYVGNRAMAVYHMPINEVAFDFYDHLKSLSRGYASFDYQLDGYEEGHLVKLSILVNEDRPDPRQLFKVALQAAIARETISPLRLSVTEGISAANVNCWRSKRPAKSVCGKLETLRSPNQLFWRPSSGIETSLFCFKNL